MITAQNKDIGSRRWQLVVNGIEDYGIFINILHHPFEENDDVHQSVVRGLNYISFCNESIQTAMPYWAHASGSDGSKLGVATFELQSTTWSHYGYLWVKEHLSSLKSGEVLEIGPGYGLFAYVMLDLLPDIHYTFLEFGDSTAEEAGEDSWPHYLGKVHDLYKTRTTLRHGYIELDEDCGSEQYDLVILTEVFEHFALAPIPTMRRIKRMVKPGGKILLTTPNWKHLTTYPTWKCLPPADSVTKERYLELIQCGHVYQYNKSELEEIFDAAGLEIEKYKVSDGKNHNFLLNPRND